MLKVFKALIHCGCFLPPSRHLQPSCFLRSLHILYPSPFVCRKAIFQYASKIRVKITRVYMCKMAAKTVLNSIKIIQIEMDVLPASRLSDEINNSRTDN